MSSNRLSIMPPKSLHGMVRDAVVQHGGNRAVVFDSGDSPSTCLTYNELFAFGNELSRQLEMAVGKHEQTIGVFCHTNIFLPAWIIGILQLPAAYVPLEPLSSSGFTLRMMDRCHLKYCLIQSSLLQHFQSVFSSFLSIDVCAEWSTLKLTLIKMYRKMPSQGSSAKQWRANNQMLQVEEARQHPKEVVPRNVHQGEQIAYVLHTSGTTGLPKIVKVPHTCIVPNIIHLRSLFQMSPDDVVFLASPLTFDPSVVEMFLALSSGACLLMVPSAVKRMPGRLAHVLFRRNMTTVLQATPTLLRQFGGCALKEEVLSAGSSLRVLALGGEACPSPVVLRSWRQEGNKTHIYNLYGTTEVSCWACCYELPNSFLASDSTEDASVPLGKSLMGTVVEVRDERGCLVTEGEGQVFIGGQERVCLLDDESIVVKGTMRATGDWVVVRDSHLYYLGRKDRLVKRHGQRVHLDNLQQAVESLPVVDACAVGLHEGSRLVAFVVPSESRNVSSTERQERHVHGSSDALADVQVSEDISFSCTSLEREVLQELSQLLPNHSLPDTVLLVPALPLTNHGKVSMEKLMRTYERHRGVSGDHAAWGDMDTARATLQSLWKDYLGLAADAVVMEDAHFILSGGDSLQALRLFDYITVTMGMTSAGLLEVILDGSFADVLKHITSMTHHGRIQTSNKRQHEGSTSGIPPKKYHTKVTSNIVSERNTSPEVSSVRRTVGFVIVRRAGDVQELYYSQNREKNSLMDSPKASEDLDRKRVPTSESCLKAEPGPSSAGKPREPAGSSYLATPADGCLPNKAGSVELNRDILAGEEQFHYVNQGSGDTSQSGTATDNQALGLRVLWRSDTGRCVDASPVLLVHPDQARVFIGSHSHRLQALDLSSGEVVWERVLGDRIESSAAITSCGNLVVAGCYDGQVYFLCVDSGDTWWVFETGDAVKSSPAIDPHTGLVIIGSHDGHVYALDPLAKCCVWKHHCGGGAVFSSPCLHSSPRLLYSATLGGQLRCLRPDSGELMWKYVSDVPLFSSPACSETCVCIGSVSGHITALSHDGHKLWDFHTDGPVFSSPCLASVPPPVNKKTGSRVYDNGTSTSPANEVLLCGSHDCSVYCLNTADGSLLWQFQTTGKVYSSPFVFDGTPWGRSTLVALTTTDGTVWVLDVEQGALKASLSLPGELFSSPVVWGRTIVVGCRNDYVYCLDLTGSKEQKKTSLSTRD
ncbi:beta-alanine-activating enzyme isoform X2 [Electrophorus electricus]|uniref:beta-alanine-activating enzyme isoform X2 n=1 Tax=Electrophorus electricus TaxID=8005 RepID=UPI0015CFF28D|nr:beta-alanine-activating enzyme isoform X2 [Electrophorus electricus]